MEKVKKKRIFSRKKTILFVCLVFLFSFSFRAEKAQAWDAWPAELAGHALDEISENIKGITMASLKQAAIEMIEKEVENLLDDIQGVGSAFISDWEDYLKGIPERESAAFMNDYLSDITEGRNSSRYRRVSAKKQILGLYEGFGGRNSYEFALNNLARADEGEDSLQDSTNYYSYLQSIGRGAINENEKLINPNYEKNLGEMFDDGNFIFLNEYLAGANNPWSFKILFEKEMRERKELLAEIQKERQSGGIKDKTDEHGNPIVPASTTAAIENKAKTLGMDVLATAETIPEVITSLVVKAINRSINQGVGALKARAQRELSNVRRQITNQTRRETQQYGPQSVFGTGNFYNQ